MANDIENNHINANIRQTGMGATRKHKTTHESRSPENVLRRRSTRTRRSPPQWWKEGSGRPESKDVNVVRILPSGFSNTTRRTAKKHAPRSNQRHKPRLQESFQSGSKDIVESDISPTATDDDGPSAGVNCTSAYEGESESQPDPSSAGEHGVLEERGTISGETPSIDVAHAETRALDPTAVHLQQSTLETSRFQKTATESKTQNDGLLLAGESKSITAKNNTLEKAEQNGFKIQRRSTSPISSQLPTGHSGETSCNDHRSSKMPSSAQLNSSSSSLCEQPNSKDSNGSVLEMKRGHETKAGPVEELLSRGSPEGRSSPLSANVSQNLPRHEVVAGVVFQFPERSESDEIMHNEDHRSPRKQTSPQLNRRGYRLAKQVRKETQNPSRLSPKMLNTAHTVAPHHSVEPRSLDDSAQWIGVEESKPILSRTFRIPKSCSSCRSHVCLCENKLDALTKETANVQSTMGFNVRRGSNIHYTTENGGFGDIKFGIRTCSDGVMVGELTICPRSATGSRRTSGQKEWYILLRGFLILEVEDSTIHLREGDEVEFEGNTVFQLRNPCLRATDLLCFLLWSR